MNIHELSGDCPVCGASVIPEERVEESEILNCGECQAMLVVDEVRSERLVLAEAPEIEEDWGE